MLIDLKWNIKMIAEANKKLEAEYPDNLEIRINPENLCERIAQGIYISGLNFECFFDYADIPRNRIEEFYSWEPRTLRELHTKKAYGKSNYGVCDNYKQLLRYYKKELNVKSRYFIISLTPIIKKEQSDWGGWRWHKWGPYIGTQKPTCEYLYNEPKIKQIYVFHILEILKKSKYVELFRPVGEKELALIKKEEYRKFPPRLKDQPIFYPVLNKEYAIQIARDWNAKYNEDHTGYVTKFSVRRKFISKYKKIKVGGKNHWEYQIPAEKLDEFNENLTSRIEVIKKYKGKYENFEV